MNLFSPVVDLSKDESPWKACKGSFLQVGLFCVPARNEFSPEGLSPFSHLNDGCMELVLVKDVNRKDFIRFLKRNGNSKNQVRGRFRNMCIRFIIYLYRVIIYILCIC